MTGPRSEGVKVDRERRIRRVPKGEDYLYTESGGGPGRTFGALRDARLGPGSSGTQHGPRRMPPTRTTGSLSNSCTGLRTAVEDGPAFGRAKSSDLQ